MNNFSVSESIKISQIFPTPIYRSENVAGKISQFHPVIQSSRYSEVPLFDNGQPSVVLICVTSDEL